MSLTYDDIPGSWGVYSRDWPRLRFETKDEVNRAFIACSKGQVVPYGSYVVVDLEIRVATYMDKEALQKYLAESPHKTYEELRAHYVSTGQWGN